MNIRSLFLCVLLYAPLTVSAAEPSARLINAYFCNDAVEVDGWLQPVKVITWMPGNHPGAGAVFVLNLLLQPGEHEIVAPVYGPDGKKFTTLNFKAEKVDQKNSPRAIWGVLKGRVPTGGVTVKVFHRKKGGKRTELGQFYLYTR